MSTTTIRLPDELRARIERLAQAQGKSAHALMVATLDEATRATEQRLEFEAEAERRLAGYRQTGEYYTLDDLRGYLLARARGDDPPEPPVRVDPEVVRAAKSRS